MELPTITMHPAEAERRFEAWAKAADQRRDEEAEAITRGYRALADGLDVVDLRDAMREAGCDDDGLPKLAIAPADARWCYLRSRRAPVSGASILSFSTDFHGTHRTRGRYARRETTVMATDVPGLRDRLARGWSSGQHRAAVPVVPPEHRPRTENGRLAALRRYHVLWEAEWEPMPPVDPALLEHLGGSLYAVHAVWDLTELERAVMARRFVS